MVEHEKPVPSSSDPRLSEPEVSGQPVVQPLPVVRPLPATLSWRKAQATLPKTTPVTPLLARQRMPGQRMPDPRMPDQRMPDQHLLGQQMPDPGHDTGPDTGAETPDAPPPITTPPGSPPPGLKPFQPPKTSRTPLGDTLTLLTMPGRGKSAPVRPEGRGRSASAPPGLPSQGQRAQGQRVQPSTGPSGSRLGGNKPSAGETPSGTDLLPIVKSPPTPQTPTAGRKLMVESTLQELTRVIRREQRQEQEDAHDRTF